MLNDKKKLMFKYLGGSLDAILKGNLLKPMDLD